MALLLIQVEDFTDLLIQAIMDSGQSAGKVLMYR